MNANYLKASAAVLLSFFAIFGGIPTANAEEQAVSKATEAQTRDFIVEVWGKCRDTTATADGDKITITDFYYHNNTKRNYTTMFLTSDIGSMRVYGDLGKLELVCRSDELECFALEKEGERRTETYKRFDRCPVATHHHLAKAFRHLIRLHDKKHPPLSF